MIVKQNSLRPDVQAVVVAQASSSLGSTNDAERHAAYERAKRAISEVCGDDAPIGKSDRIEYARAVQSYVRMIGL